MKYILIVIINHYRHYKLLLIYYELRIHEVIKMKISIIGGTGSQGLILVKDLQ